MTEATRIGAPPGVPQYSEVLRLGLMATKLKPAASPAASGVVASMMLTWVVLPTDPLLAEPVGAKPMLWKWVLLKTTIGTAMFVKFAATSDAVAPDEMNTTFMPSAIDAGPVA